MLATTHTHTSNSAKKIQKSPRKKRSHFIFASASAIGESLEEKKRRMNHKNREKKLRATNVGEGWRQRLAEKCLQRARQNRQQAMFLSRGRSSLEFLPAFVDEEIRKERQSVSMHASSSGDDFLQMTQEEYEDLLLYLENTIILEEEREKVRQYEEFERYEDSLLDEENERVLCPLCQTCFLQLQSGLLFCSCGLRVNVQLDGITLCFIRERIHGVLSEHAKLCPFDIPKFYSLDRFGASNLFFQCPQCGVTEAIL